MPKTREAKCSRCGVKHPAPTGKKCKQQLSSTVSEEPNTLHEEVQVTDGQLSVNREDHIIQLLTEIKDKQQALDDRVMQLELSATSKSSLHQQSQVQQKVNIDDFGNNGIVPTLETLRNTDGIQRQVADRLRDLEQATAYKGNLQYTNNSKPIKSGRFRGAEAQVTKNVPWPHELCFVGAARKTVNYDDLTPLQFTVGFLKSVQLEKSQSTRDAMIDYFLKLAQDACDVNWPVARGANAVIYSTLEQGRVEWDQVAEIDRLRMLYTQRSSVAENTSKGSNEKRRVICFNFNNNKCTKASDHDKDGVTYRHICRFCFSATRKPFSHSEVDCRRRRDDGNQH